MDPQQTALYCSVTGSKMLTNQLDLHKNINKKYVQVFLQGMPTVNYSDDEQMPPQGIIKLKCAFRSSQIPNEIKSRKMKVHGGLGFKGFI